VLESCATTDDPERPRDFVECFTRSIVEGGAETTELADAFAQQEETVPTRCEEN
jgi:hypothetical protein